MEGAIFLPYHCPRLSIGNFLRSPCAGKIAEAEAVRTKFPQALLGALEHCLDCRGRHLVVREKPVIPPDEKIEASTSRTIEEVIPPTEELIEGKLEDNPLSPKEDSMNHSARNVSEPPPCPKHPEKPQVACGPESKRAGQYLGACKLCMAERKIGRKPKATKEKMTPAVARDLAKKSRSPGETPGPPKDQAVCQNTPSAPEINVQSSAVAHDPPRCITHNLPIKFNAKGFSMGGCEECRREIAALGGHKARILLAQSPLERVFAKHRDELAWLCSYAQKQVRTPEGQLIFMVKQAMAQGE